MPLTRHGLDQRQHRGPARGKQQACGEHLPEPVGRPQQHERSQRGPGQRDQDRAAASCPVSGEADGRREHDAGEGRGSEQDGDLVGVEVAPMQPNRQIRQVAAANQEHRGIKETEQPSSRPRSDACFNLFGHRL